jgi:hypothetical protein
MYKILTASADAYITNKVISTTARAIDANMGNASTIDIFKLYDESTFSGHPKTYSNAGVTLLLPGMPIELSRGLVKFDLSDLTAAQTITTGFSATLKMYDVFGGQTTPSNFSLLVVPLAKEFDEGGGRDVESFNDLDVCNFVTASYSDGVTTTWDTHGTDGDNNLYFNINSEADYETGYDATQEFETGQEDLSVDVTAAVIAMLAESGGITNYGFRISFISEEEIDEKTRFVKRFVSRHSNDKNKTPRLIITTPSATTETADVEYANYQATILNLKEQYTAGDKVRLHIFVEDRNYNSVEATKLPIANTGVIVGANKDVEGTLCYSIIDSNTDDIIIPFDDDTTLVSFDSDEMHMILDTAGLVKGFSYKIKFRLKDTSDTNNTLQYTIGKDNIFKVV